MVACAAAAGAQTPSGPEVVVTATRFDDVRERLPVGVTIVRRDDIERSAASTLPELLSQLGGVHARDNTGSLDRQIDLRGMGITGDQNTLVLIDGQRLSEIELVSPKWSAIPLDAIERIEVMRGSGAVLYGGGATGGTINIVTRSPRPGERSAKLAAGLGTWNTRELRGAATLATEAVGLRAIGSQYESDGYRANNHVRQRNVDAEVRYVGRGARLGVKLSGDDQSLRNPGARTAAQLVTDRRGATTPDDFSTRSGGRIHLDAGMKLGEADLTADLAWRERRADANQFFFGALSVLATRVDVASFSPRIRVPLRTGTIDHSLVLGIDVDRWDYDSTFRGGFFASQVEATQTNRALYAQDAMQLGPSTRLMVGARAQHTENTITEQLPFVSRASQSRTPHAWEVSLRHALDERWHVFGKLGRSFRIATIDENRFQPTLLEPQTSHDGELGVELLASGTKLRAALFRMDLKNEIYFSPLVVPPFGANVNLSPTQREGIELEASHRIARGVDAFVALTVTSARFREGTYGGVDVSGRDVPLVPRHVLVVGGSWEITAATRLNAVLRHVGTQRFDNDQANTFAQTMPRYTTVDLKLTHRQGPWLLGAAVRNLANEHYFSYGIVNGAGTSFSAYPAAERSVFFTAEYTLQ